MNERQLDAPTRSLSLSLSIEAEYYFASKMVGSDWLRAIPCQAVRYQEYHRTRLPFSLFFYVLLLLLLLFCCLLLFGDQSFLWYIDSLSLLYYPLSSHSLLGLNLLSPFFIIIRSTLLLFDSLSLFLRVVYYKVGKVTGESENDEAQQKRRPIFFQLISESL